MTSWADWKSFMLVKLDLKTRPWSCHRQLLYICSAETDSCVCVLCTDVFTDLLWVLLYLYTQNRQAHWTVYSLSCWHGELASKQLITSSRSRTTLIWSHVFGNLTNIGRHLTLVWTLPTPEGNIWLLNALQWTPAISANFVCLLFWCWASSILLGFFPTGNSCLLRLEMRQMRAEPNQ